uniref:Uncharacterized protein n=1 Tax=Anguilla anguilla TaxID=7936 RepID=A0A0E9T7W3_ANGAN
MESSEAATSKDEDTSVITFYLLKG